MGGEKDGWVRERAAVEIKIVEQFKEAHDSKQESSVGEDQSHSHQNTSGTPSNLPTKTGVQEDTTGTKRSVTVDTKNVMEKQDKQGSGCCCGKHESEDQHNSELSKATGDTRPLHGTEQNKSHNTDLGKTKEEDTQPSTLPKSKSIDSKDSGETGSHLNEDDLETTEEFNLNVKILKGEEGHLSTNISSSGEKKEEDREDQSNQKLEVISDGLNKLRSSINASSKKEDKQDSTQPGSGTSGGLSYKKSEEPEIKQVEDSKADLKSSGKPTETMTTLKKGLEEARSSLHDAYQDQAGKLPETGQDQAAMPSLQDIMEGKLVKPTAEKIRILAVDIQTQEKDDLKTEATVTKACDEVSASGTVGSQGDIEEPEKGSGSCKCC